MFSYTLGTILKRFLVFSLVSLERVHTPRYLHFLRTAWSAWSAMHEGHAGQDLLPAVWPAPGIPVEAEPEDFLARLGLFAQDACTPIGPHTWLAAKTGADCAINASFAPWELCQEKGGRGWIGVSRGPISRRECCSGLADLDEPTHCSRRGPLERQGEIAKSCHDWDP